MAPSQPAIRRAYKRSHLPQAPRPRAQVDEHRAASRLRRLWCDPPRSRDAAPNPPNPVRHSDGGRAPVRRLPLRRRFRHPPAVAGVRLGSERCTRELRDVQAELASRHSFREAARLLAWLLPCSPPHHATVRNRLHGITAGIEAVEAAAVPGGVITTEPADEPDAADPVVMIDGAHIPAVPGLRGRCIDVTVGKVETAGQPPRRFGLAPEGAERPALAIRAALVEHGWMSTYGPPRPQEISAILPASLLQRIRPRSQAPGQDGDTRDALLVIGPAFDGHRQLPGSRVAVRLLGHLTFTARRHRWPPPGAFPGSRPNLEAVSTTTVG